MAQPNRESFYGMYYACVQIVEYNILDLYEENNKCNEIYFSKLKWFLYIVKLLCCTHTRAHKLLKMQNSGTATVGEGKMRLPVGEERERVLDWKLATWKPHITSFVFSVYLAMIFDWMNWACKFNSDHNSTKLSFWVLYWTFARHAASLSGARSNWIKCFRTIEQWHVLACKWIGCEIASAALLLLQLF